MSRFGLTLALLLLCLPLRAEERRYLELTTDEFTLVSAASESRTREIARRIAMFRAAVEQAFGIELSAVIPTRIYALSREDWTRHARLRRGLAGYFLAHPFSSDLLFDVDAAGSGAYELMLHEYTHYVLRTFSTAELPAFFDEGLAEVFGAATFHDDEVRFEPRLDHVQHLRRHAWLPFERLLEVRRHDPEYVDHALAPGFYAQAWATLYFAMAADPAFGRRILEYLGELESGTSRLQAAERLIGDTSARANRDIGDFILRRKRLPVATIRISRPLPHDGATVRRLDAEESNLALGELLLRMGNRSDAALELFERVRRLDPEATRAQVGAAWAHLQKGERERAAQLLDAAAESSPDAAQLGQSTLVALGRGHFQLSVESSHESESLDESQRRRLTRARELFRRVLDQDPQHLEAINGYVLASLALQEQDESLIPLAQSAHRLAPRSAELAVALAILHELAGRKDLARPYWQAAARNTHAAPMRARILDELEESPPRTSAPAR